jgi:hypothetical protein
MNERPELLDYVVLFESEPEWVHEMGWFYGARFVLRRGRDTIVATIAPDEAEFWLEWHQDGRRLINLKLVMVTEWLIQRLKGKEQLFLKATSDREILCTVTLKPEVSVEMEALW